MIEELRERHRVAVSNLQGEVDNLKDELKIVKGIAESRLKTILALVELIRSIPEIAVRPIQKNPHTLNHAVFAHIHGTRMSQAANHIRVLNRDLDVYGIKVVMVENARSK